MVLISLVCSSLCTENSKSWQSQNRSQWLWMSQIISILIVTLEDYILPKKWRRSQYHALIIEREINAYFLTRGQLSGSTIWYLAGVKSAILWLIHCDFSKCQIHDDCAKQLLQYFALQPPLSNCAITESEQLCEDVFYFEVKSELNIFKYIESEARITFLSRIDIVSVI